MKNGRFYQKEAENCFECHRNGQHKTPIFSRVFTAKYSPWPLCAGLVAGVGGPDVLAYLLDDGEQLRVLAGVEA